MVITIIKEQIKAAGNIVELTHQKKLPTKRKNQYEILHLSI